MLNDIEPLSQATSDELIGKSTVPAQQDAAMTLELHFYERGIYERGI